MALPCPRCTRLAREDARYCDGCGLPLPAAAELPPGAGLADSGRERELAVLDQRVLAAIGGRGGTLALCGEPGIGKTHTALEAARRAAARGVHVFWGRCNEEPGAPPYWPWQQLLTAWVAGQDDSVLQALPPATATSLADLLPEQAARLPSRSAPAAGAPDALQARFRRFEAIAGVWKHAAAQAPLLLVLDNLHWADASSLRLLEFLAPELERQRLLLLITYRDMELSRQHPLSGTLGELASGAGFERLRLLGVDRSHTALMMARAAAAPVPAALVDEVHQRTEGHPLFVAEMTRLLLQEGQLDAAPRARGTTPRQRIPEGIKEVIGRRLNRLSESTNQVLTTAATLGRDFDSALLVRVLEARDEDACLLALEEALRARVLETLDEPGRYRFAHALFRDTLYEEIPPPRRSRLHLRVAQALEQLAEDSPRVLASLAWHHGAALPGGDPARAADFALRAAEQAGSMLAHEEAARYYRLALQGMEAGTGFAPGLRCRLLNGLGEAHTRAGDYLVAQQAFEQAARLAQEEERPGELARAALGFEMASWCPGMPGVAAARWLREALEATSSEDLATVTRLLSALARALIYSGEETQALQVYEQALASARRCGDLRILATTLVAMLPARWQRDRRPERVAAAQEARRLAAAAGDRAAEIDASAWSLFDHFEAGDMQAWRSGMLDYERAAEEELRERFPLYVGSCMRTMHALLEGRFDEVEPLARRTFEIGARMPGLDASGVRGVQMFTLRREQGRLVELAPVVRQMVQDSGHAKLWRPGLALVYLELGQLEDARREFELLARDNFAGVPRDGVWMASTAYVAEVCCALADAARAAILYERLRPHAGGNLIAGTSIACVGAADMLLGMLAATQRRWESSEQHFRAALAFNEQQGARPALAHTRRHYAAMLLARSRGRDRVEAATQLAAAAEEAAALGMRALQAQVAALQLQAGPAPQRRAYPGGLSEREAQVLRLVADGKSNRQIADTLFVSPNTVANHVRSILSKTASTNRTEAAAFAVRNALARTAMDEGARLGD